MKRLLLKKMTLVLILYTICRILFIVFNFHHFPDLSTTIFVKAMLYGVLFDISAIAYSNVPIILLSILPFSFCYQRWYQNLLGILFLAVNIFCLGLNVLDMGYYQYIFRRTTADVVGVKNDVSSLIPTFLHDFWYLFVVLFFLSVLFYKMYRHIRNSHDLEPPKYYSAEILPILVVLLVTIIGARGSFGYEELRPITAASYVPRSNVSLVTNTPFTIIKSLAKKQIEPKHYLPPTQCGQYCTNMQCGDAHFAPTVNKQPNVLVIVLESFSSEYMGYFNCTPYTPFLDSLFQHSLVCTHAYANGKHSNIGIVSIMSSIPPLMGDAFMISNYKDNHIDGLGNVLKQQNYSTAFFHGGNDGTFDFDKFSQQAGFDEYIGRKAYNNDADYDNHWGIYDEPFLQFTAQNLNQLPQPFGAAVFTLSSHHPFSLPIDKAHLYPEGTEPIHKTVRYTDNALRQFFKTAEQMPWFRNTLFVIVADHAGPAASPYTHTKVGMYDIPIAFYYPDGSLQGTYNRVVQQIDIMPTILDYIGNSVPYMAFGQSIFDPTHHHYAYSYAEEMYQVLSDEYCLQFDGKQNIGFYHYPSDSLLQRNLIGHALPTEDTLQQYLKATIQTYNNAMLHNQLSHLAICY